MDLLREFATGSWSLLWKMFAIVIPMMVLLELFEGSRAYRGMVRGWSRIVGWLGFSEQTAAPTLIGFLFGLVYGGGIIVRDAKRHDLGRAAVFPDGFLEHVHAMIEIADPHRGRAARSGSCFRRGGPLR